MTQQDDKQTHTPVNPATGEEMAPVELWSMNRVSNALEMAAETFRKGRGISVGKRAGWMSTAGELLKKRKDDLARQMAREMGKPISQGRSEVEKCAWVCHFYAENAERFLRTEAVEAKPEDRSFISYQPIGPVFAVMPWNFPLWQVYRFAAPALMAGNVGLLKHARNVQGSAHSIEAIFLEAGFPEGCFINLPIGHEEASRVIADKRVRAVTMTGSTDGGRKVAAAAGEHLKKSVLELGGSDAYVVLEDADLDLAAEICATSRLINSGQSCIAAKRFIVVEGVHDAFAEKFIEKMKSASAAMGDPMKEETKVGPMARFDLRDDLAEQVERSVKEGAECPLGGKIPRESDLARGAYYPATVLTNVRPGMAAFDEELFGPVGAIIRAADEKDAIDLANQSSFGLGGAVFTRDLERGERIARDEMDCGAVAVNGLVASDPRLPFGGVKDSGYGRELGRFGIREFVNIKAVVSSGAAS